MFKTNLTLTQHSAIVCDASPLVVRAGAGSGKTRVLVERYLRLVLGQGIPPARILAATFTEKAAAQMKERVAKELMASGQSALIAEINAAPICTLHSFCSRLIAPHALTWGLDPNYRIMEEHEARLRQEETLNSLLARWRQQRPEDLKTIVDGLHWSTDYHLRPGRSPASRGFSRQFLDLVQSVRCAGKADQPPFSSLNISPLQADAQIAEYLRRLDALLWGIESTRAAKSQEKALAARRFLDGFRQLSDKHGLPALEIVQNLSKVSLNVSREVKEVLRPLRAELCPLLLDYCCQPKYNSLCTALDALFAEFLQYYTDQKRQSGLLDFLDLEEMALQSLLAPDAPRPVDFILLDEAQDLNPVQWQLISILAQHAPLFAVGDAQQAIYGFRDADVQIFNRRAQEAREGSGQEILLSDNFRSRQSVLAIVNRFFERLWNDDAGAPFLRLGERYPYPPQPDDAVELQLSSGADRQTARENEALLLARRLRELVSSPDFNVHREIGQNPEGQVILRPDSPRWGDMVVLVRSGSSFAPLERAFQSLSIPHLIQAGRGFWDALEISDLLALMRCLEDPGDNFSLACVLRSPAVGFDDDDLLELRLLRTPCGVTEPRGSIRSVYGGLITLADAAGPKTSLPYRCYRFLSLFIRLYHLKDRRPVRQILQSWIEETSLESHWADEQHSGIIQANVRKFLRLCDAHAGESPQRLRAAFEEMRLRDLQESSASAASDQGAVRVMTVHSAKGLEAPIVAVFDMNYKPRGSAGAFAYSMADGAAFSIEGSQAGDKPIKPQLFEKIGNAKGERSQIEDQRVLYVAMTRAREKLILSASRSESEKGPGRAQGWLKLLMDANLLPGSDQLFDANVIPSGRLQIPDQQGVTAPLALKRESDVSPLTSAEIMKPAPAGEKIKQVPNGFPALPESGGELISVVEYLAQQADKAMHGEPSATDEYPWDEEIGGADFGRWLHRILQVAPLDCDAGALEGIARREARTILRLEPEPDQIDRAVQLSLNFLRSPLAQEAHSSSVLLREFPILFDLKGTLLKGKLDMVFQDERGWTIIDFKSDKTPGVDRLESYRSQLSLYAQGWELLTGSSPHRALLFFLESGDLVDIPR